MPIFQSLDQRFLRKRVHRFAPPAILDREQSPLLEIETGSIGSRQVRRTMTQPAQKRSDRCGESKDAYFQAARI